MDVTPARSVAGAARRSRRLQGSSGHTGGATTASGSPYARPTLKHDSSSQILAALESGGQANGISNDAIKFGDHKKTGGADGIFGRFRRGLGWLVGRQSELATSQAESIGELDEGHLDEESMLSGSTRSRTRAPPVATPRVSNHFSRNPPMSLPKRDYGGTPSILSHDGHLEGDESSAAKKLRTSHSTLNLPTRRSSPPKTTRQAHASLGTDAGRAFSPNGPLSPRLELPERQGASSARNKSSIFATGPLGTSLYHRPNGTAASSRRSVSPGGMSQYALASQPTSVTSSTFGLQSQSPFRTGGHSARSPDLAALNISSGLARSPSLPANRLLNLQQQGSRLYPYQRSPSTLSGLARPSVMMASQSVGSALSGLKRDHRAISTSPPKMSPGRHTFSQASPTGTDFSSNFSHRNKRQRVSVAWHPEQGFISTDADGHPLRTDDLPVSVPKNEAERILERLENIRRPQIDGLRSSSPRRLNVPLPAPTGRRESIFATRISSSQTEPNLAGYAISPYSRRQQAYREERALRRDKINSRGGLGEHLRAAHMGPLSPQSHSTHDGADADADDMESPQHQQDNASNFDEQEDEELLPKLSNRRTRQRTRELSVLSDTSIQMDGAMTSPRRSTRIRKKPVEEPLSPRRERKSAKSPPPTSSKRGAGKSKRPTQDVAAETQSDIETEDLRTSRAASPRPFNATDKQAIRTGKATLPTDDSQSASIDQVMSARQPVETPAKEPSTQRAVSAREHRLRTTTEPKSRGFSAKDDEDDLPPASVEVPEQPKLKLPNSVFANRFSFGRSPSSSLLASPSSTVAHAMGNGPASGAGSSTSDSTTALPKLALPSSAFASNNNHNSVSAEQAVRASTTSFTSLAKENQEPTIKAASSDTNSLPAPAGQAEPSTSKPLFAFTAPASGASKTTQGLFQAPVKESESSVTRAPSFSFAPSNSAPQTNPESTQPNAKVAPFTFGQASSKRKPEEATSSFSFGKPAQATATEAVPVIDVTKLSNPFAAFPSSGSTTPAISNTAKPSFSFGQPANASVSPASIANASSAAPGLSPSTSSVPAFSFTASTPGTSPAFGSTATDSGKAAAADGMQSSPPPAAATSAAPVNAPFSPVIQPIKTPSFSFSQTASSSNSAPPASQPPTFAFGGQSSSQDDTKSRSSSPFSVGAPAQPFAFGSNTSTSKPASGAFAFGASKPEVKEAEKPASAGGFSFGSASSAAATGSAPAFSFGASKPATSNPFAAIAGTQPAGNAFGSTTPAVTPNNQPTAAFGQSNTNGSSAPSFSFGASSNGASGNASTPAFSFGGAGAAAVNSTPSFSFGSANAPSSAQPFAFGAGASGAPTPSASSATAPSFNFNAAGIPGTQPASPAGAPTGLGPAGGSFFTMGAGDTPTSPNKARRPVKPLRRPR